MCVRMWSRLGADHLQSGFTAVGSSGSAPARADLSRIFLGPCVGRTLSTAGTD